MVKMIQTRTDPADQGSGMGRVSRTRRLRTTVRNCTRDEGGPFEAGGQVQVSSHRKLLSLRAMVVLCQEGARAPCAGTAHPCSAANAISAAVWLAMVFSSFCRQRVDMAERRIGRNAGIKITQAATSEPRRSSADFSLLRTHFQQPHLTQQSG